MDVQDLMSRQVATIPPDQSCWDATVLMARLGVHHLPVVDPGGCLCGILTDRDVRSFVLQRVAASTESNPVAVDQAMRRTPVSQVMSGNVVVVGPRDRLADAVRLMAERRIGSIPVVEDCRLVGILTESDVIQHLARRDVFRAREVESVLFPIASS